MKRLRGRNWVRSITPPAPSATTPPLAPRPHRITIWLGLVSPFIGVVAVWFSLQSLKVSKEAMEIGQRAYVRVSGPFYGWCRDERKEVGLTFQIHNDGNTPATLSQWTFRYRSIGESEASDLETSRLIGVVNGHSTDQRTVLLHRLAAQKQTPIANFFNLYGSLTTIDVFNKKQTTSMNWLVTCDPLKIEQWQQVFPF
jgi:hypothetical protein